MANWRVNSTMRTNVVLYTLQQALYDRQPGSSDALVHHSDRGSQYLSIRYPERLAEVGIEPSVGSRGDSYDNALSALDEKRLNAPDSGRSLGRT
jgi:transposase InsO family protein